MFKKIGEIKFLQQKCVSLFLIMTFLLTTSLVCADDISFEASVDTNKVSLGSTIQLTLTINNAKNPNPIRPPNIDGFEVRFLGPSTRVSIVNGQYSSSTAFIYTLFPQKVGNFKIPSMGLTINGKTYASSPIDIEVVDAQTAAPNTGGQEGNQPASPKGIEDKIFLTLEVPKKEVYEGEKIPVTIKLFVNGVSVRDVQMPTFDHTGFSADDFGKPNQYQQNVGGVAYNVVEFNINVYPTRTGEWTLGPANLNCNILYKASHSRKSPFGSSFGDLDQFFNDDFFSGFFDDAQRQPLALKSVTRTINVLALPQENKPQDFSAGVGQFDFNVQVGPATIKTGDPVTLKMTVTGDGDLKSIKMPSPSNVTGFKLYDPQVKEEGGTKVLEQVLIPTTKDVKEVPAISFNYFDPGEKAYKTITRGPFPITVTAPEKEDELKIVAPVAVPQIKTNPVAQEPLGRDVVFIKEDPGNFTESNSYLYKNPMSIIFVVVLTVFFVAVRIIYAKTNRLKTDAVYAKRLLAPRKARKGLEDARRFMEQRRQKEFYDAIFKLLQEYFADKFHIPAGTITVAVIRDVFGSKGIDSGVLEKVQSIFQNCEMIRYASLELDEKAMEGNMRKAQEIIDFLERAWR